MTRNGKKTSDREGTGERHLISKEEQVAYSGSSALHFRLELDKGSDRPWPAEEGWVKMQQLVQSGGREGPINVHYVWNRITGAVDDFKIILPGAR